MLEHEVIEEIEQPTIEEIVSTAGENTTQYKKLLQRVDKSMSSYEKRLQKDLKKMGKEFKKRSKVYKKNGNHKELESLTQKYRERVKEQLVAPVATHENALFKAYINRHTDIAELSASHLALYSVHKQQLLKELNLSDEQHTIVNQYLTKRENLMSRKKDKTDVSDARVENTALYGVGPAVAGAIIGGATAGVPGALAGGILAWGASFAIIPITNYFANKRFKEEKNYLLEDTVRELQRVGT